jgi:hypothetical protein
MDHFHDKIHRIFESHEKRSDELFELLKQEDDTVSVVLRGHLVLEQLLFAAIAAHCPNPAALQGARLRFIQLLPLLEALQNLPALPEYAWTALRELNSLRNSLAHDLDAERLNKRLAAFLVEMRKGNFEKELPESKSDADTLKRALSYLVGMLSVLGPFHAAVEALKAHQADEGSKVAAQELPPNTSLERTRER